MGLGQALFSNRLVFDPAVTAVASAQTPAAGIGGGNIGGNGTFFSLATVIERGFNVSETLFFTGTLAGTLTVEVDNSSTELDDYDADVKGKARWQTYDKINGGGFVNGVATLVAGTISGGTNPGGYGCERPVPFGRIRLKAIITGGTGTIEDRRVAKDFAK